MYTVYYYTEYLWSRTTLGSEGVSHIDTNGVISLQGANSISYDDHVAGVYWISLLHPRL